MCNGHLPAEFGVDRWRYRGEFASLSAATRNTISADSVFVVASPVPPAGCHSLPAPTDCRKSAKALFTPPIARATFFCVTAVISRQTEGLLNILVPQEFLSRNTTAVR